MKYFFLAEDFSDLLNKRNELLEDHKEIGKAVGEATAQSSETWHDNAVFDIARDTGRIIENRIQKLELIINHAVVVSPPAGTELQIAVGSLVKVRYKSSPGELWFRIGSYEVTRKKLSMSTGQKVIAVSYASPIGSCLLKKQAGSEASFSADGKGNLVHLYIVEVINGMNKECFH